MMRNMMESLQSPSLSTWMFPLWFRSIGFPPFLGKLNILIEFPHCHSCDRESIFYTKILQKENWHGLGKRKWWLFCKGCGIWLLPRLIVQKTQEYELVLWFRIVAGSIALKIQRKTYQFTDIECGAWCWVGEVGWALSSHHTTSQLLTTFELSQTQMWQWIHLQMQPQDQTTIQL